MMNRFAKLLKYAWISTAYIWLAALLTTFSLTVFASGKNYRDFDAAAGHTFKISVGRGHGRTVYVTHAYYVVYNGVMDVAMASLIVFMLGAVFMAMKPTPKKDRPADWP